MNDNDNKNNNKNNPDYKKTIINLIEKTNNPLAPFAFSDLLNGIEKTGKVIAPLCDQTRTNELLSRLTCSFTTTELDHEIGKSPEFLLALMSMTKTTGTAFMRE